MDFPNPLAFASHLTKVHAQLPAAKREGLRAGALVLHREVTAAMGTYRYGWPPLSRATVAKKGADTPLLASGQLRASIGYMVVDDENAYVGTNDRKAIAHEYGTRHTPPRPFMGAAAFARQAAIAQAMVAPSLAVLAGQGSPEYGLKYIGR
jgi:phage gpG-like protein